MRVVSQLVPTMVALLVACNGAVAQTHYVVNGKPVNASTYQAYRLVNESIALMKQNRLPEATAKLHTALKLDPGVSEARIMMATVDARLGRTEEAIEQMRMGLVTMPADADAGGEPRKVPAEMNLGGLYLAAGRSQDAVELYQKLLSEYPDTKSAPALRERVDLLQHELDRQKRARVEHRDEAIEDANYYANVISGGRKRWPSKAMPIRVYVYSGAALNGWNPAYEKILRDSFQEWASASHGHVSFSFVPSPRDADVTCNWVEDTALLGSSAEGGEAQVQSHREGILGCKIVLSLNDAGSAFPLTPNLVRVLCLHEIGHALGLVGHSGRVGDVMYCSMPLVDREQHLSARDKATLNVLYDSDVDTLSGIIADLDKKTNGNSENLLRFGVVMLTVILAAIIGGVAMAKRTGKKARKKRRP